MDLGDIAAWKLDDRRAPLIGRIRPDEYGHASLLAFGKRAGKICNLVAGRFAAIRVGKMAVGHKYGQLAEGRFDADASICVTRTPDLDTGRMRVVGDDFPVRKGQKAAQERGDAVGGEID